MLHSDTGKPARFQSDPVAREGHGPTAISLGHRRPGLEFRGALAPRVPSIAPGLRNVATRSASAALCDTSRMIPVLISVVSYLVASGLLVAGIRRERRAPAWLFAACIGMLAHALEHSLVWRSLGGADMHFFAAISLVTLGMALLTTVVGARGRMASLGVVVYPIAAAALLGSHLHGHRPPEPLDWRLQLHAWLALLAYATLAVAALLAVMLWLQERALSRREVHGWLRALPPLVELETLLFRTIATGFVLLSATLLTGLLFVEDLLAQHLVHKTVLSLLSWLVFGVLLLGRGRQGWRGRTAVHWTLAAMVLLVLAFFGSKFVLELVLGRA